MRTLELAYFQSRHDLFWNYSDEEPSTKGIAAALTYRSGVLTGLTFHSTRALGGYAVKLSPQHAFRCWLGIHSISRQDPTTGASDSMHILNGALEYSERSIRGIQLPDLDSGGLFLSAVAQNKLPFVFGRLERYRKGPLFLSDGSTILLPEASLSDQELYGRKQAGTDEDILLYVEQEFARVQRLRGLFVLRLSDTFFSRKNSVRILRKFFEKLDGKPVWKTSLGQVGQWWRARAGMLHSVIQGPSGTLELHVENHSAESVNSPVVIDVGSHQSLRKLSASRSLATLDDDGSLKVSRIPAVSSPLVFRVDVPEIKPGERRTFKLFFDEPPGAGP